MPKTISIVIAVKDPRAEQFRLCLSSFAALANANVLQLIIVKSGSMPDISSAIRDRFKEFIIIEMPSKGIYPAYNIGCDFATGCYTLFFGTDDIALPGMNTIFDDVLLRDIEYDMVAAACYMQSTGISRPSRHRTGLIFANWCHQGIFYSTRYLKATKFETKYAIQADHKMNIDLVANRNNRIFISSVIVAYFSAGGASSTRPDLQFRADFPTIVGRAYGRPWGWLVRLKQVAINIIKGPPERAFLRNHRSSK